MGRGIIKHEIKIIEDIKNHLQNVCKIISQDQLISIISKYYSTGYSEDGGYKSITRSILKRGLVVEVKMKLPPSFNIKTSKHSTPIKMITLFLSTLIPTNDRQIEATKFLKDIIVVSQKSIKRSISKDILDENFPKISKHDDLQIFPLKFRAMMFHLYLITTFKPEKLNKVLISKKIPINLYYQIFNNINDKYFNLNPNLLIIPNDDIIFEIENLISYLKPPFHPLIINNTLQKEAIIDIPSLNIYKKLNFYKDPFAHKDYWNIINSLSNDNYLFPYSIYFRFENYMNNKFSNLSLQQIPFFPREIEEFSLKYNISIPIISNFCQKMFKKKLKQIQCSRKSFLDIKFYPSSDIYSILVTGSSALPCKKIKLVKFLKNFNNLISKNGIIIYNNFKYKQKDLNYLSNFLNKFHKFNNNNYNDLILLNQIKLINLYSIKNQIFNLNHSVSIALEISKVFLNRNIFEEPNRELILRQIIHLKQNDLRMAIWCLDSLKILKK